MGFVPERLDLVPIDDDGSTEIDGDRYVACANAAHGVCNWLTREADSSPLCRACRYNRTIPDLAVPGNAERWRRLELAKHRLIFSLLSLRLPVPDRAEDPELGLCFDFLAPSDPEGETSKVTTGHNNGLITINAAEADDWEREKTRWTLNEAYRTLLGHFRHEVGHWYWSRLVSGEWLEEFRRLFGDDTADYASALAAHYENGPPADWQNRYVSAYASAHPWEDFAETWAHFLHIVDALETAAAFRIDIDPTPHAGALPKASLDRSPYQARSIQQLVDNWIALTFAVNSLNRSLGVPDLYPFVLAPAAIEKLDFVFRLVNSAASRDEPVGQSTAA